MESDCAERGSDTAVTNPVVIVTIIAAHVVHSVVAVAPNYGICCTSDAAVCGCCVQEFEEYYEMKLGRKPTLVRKSSAAVDEKDKMPPIPARAGSSRSSSTGPGKGKKGCVAVSVSLWS
jgi:hypothetical protein